MKDTICQLYEIAADCDRAIEGAPVLASILAGSASTRDYETFLAQSFHYVSATHPMLRRAAAALHETGRYPGLVAHYERKAEEEEGHDRWLAADAGALTGGAESTLQPPSAAVQAYLAWNQFTIVAGMPIAFFGTAFVLEYLAVKRASRVAEGLVASGTIPGVRGALRFLRGHGASDEHHLPELAEALEQITERGDEEDVLLSARTTARLYPRFFVVDGSPGRGP